MEYKYVGYYYILLILVIGCKTGNIKSQKNKQENLKTWHQKDYNTDKLPGISLEKFLSKSKSLKSNNQIIVAVLDTQIDTNHEDLKDAIWVNTDEIPNNKIDDDKNGYVDDINGWNFIGTKSGDYTVWGNFEYTRIVRDYTPVFKDKKREEIAAGDLFKYDEYLRALKYQDKWSTYYTNFLKSLKYNTLLYPSAKDTLKYYFPKEDYTLKQLDSVYNLYKKNNKTYKERRNSGDTDFASLVLMMKVNLELYKDFEELNDKRTQLDSIANKNLNINYNERISIGDNEKVLEKGYGNGKINSKLAGTRRLFGHSTKVSSIIAANRKNNIGIKGFSDNIKIMPLSISPSGDESDKDVAASIYYAVDNGAKVINMSFMKEFSLHPEWVIEAMQYAEKHNVLLVHGSGNDAFDIDTNPTYPNDYYYDGKEEVCGNLISVGSISSRVDSTFVSDFSNYGKKNVDLFAPGENIYTAIPENEYESGSGTSLSAPMVSGTAALIWLYYPNLTVQEVKQIILDSGTAYDIEVLIPGEKGKKTHFRELSKTGKVLNVYNAMELAKKISKTKSEEKKNKPQGISYRN
ncbi:S8 family peptidase [Flavobacterium amniphilum]|uniref:S8 family peptidase n=1 Tax=Flavobacterium amniphilum TaxID=1834035 RepID=UPI002029BA0C|nr:S8 family peptidase [Flavobacterium amniphilum]MCL9807361.1 S8 family peptidase [Flavobacterium amniphilum]